MSRTRRKDDAERGPAWTRESLKTTPLRDDSAPWYVSRKQDVFPARRVHAKGGYRVVRVSK